MIAVDLLQARLDLAKRLGAFAVVNGTDGSAAEQIKALTGGRGADICIEASGATPALNEAVRACAYSAKVVAMGFSRARRAASFWAKSSTTTGSTSSARRSPASAPS